MAAKRLSPLTIIVIAVGAAGAAWVSGGALTVTSPQPYAPRVGVLPSPFWLALWVLVAAVAAFGARRRPERLGLLAVSAVLFAPWIPFRVPAAFHVWTGPLKTWLWALIAAGTVLPLFARRMPQALGRIARDPRRAPWLAGLIAATVYVAGASRVFPQLPAGDEPHYLVITQSLLIDHDLKIENNHRRGDYHAYYPVDLKPDYRRRGTNEEIYSIHAPGLPVIIAPAFALLGYTGVLAFLSILSGFATALAWKAAWNVTSDVASTWFGWATVALTAPFFFQSFVAYPDAVGALIVMIGVLALTGSLAMSRRALIGTGIGLAVLPWLHTRYALAAVCLGLLILIRQFREHDRIRRAMAFLAIPAVSAVCWFAFFYTIYGTPDPRAPYGGNTQSSPTNLPQGLVGLLFDQQFGLLPTAPVYFCALSGMAFLARRVPRLTTELIAVAVPYTLVVAAFEMWWGGESSPARFLVPVLLPLAIPASIWFQANRGRTMRVLGLAALALSVLITVTLAGVDRGGLLYNSRDGASKLFLWLSPLVNVTTGLPSVFRTGPGTALLHATVWLLSLAVTTAVGLAIERRGAASVTIAVVIGLSAVATGSTALAIVWRSQAASPVTMTTGTLAFLRQYDTDSGQIAVGYAPVRRLDSRELLAKLTIADVTPARLTAAEPLILLFRIPAGTYLVDSSASGEASGQLTATLDRSFGSQWQWDIGGTGRRLWQQEIRLPVPVPAILVDAGMSARHALDRVVLRPVSISGSNHRLAAGEPQHVARYGSAVVFLMGGQAYMERQGAWIPGGGSADFVVAPDSGTGVQLFVRNTPVENVITLEGATWRQDLKLAPGEERLVALPAAPTGSPGSTAFSLQVTAARGARPTEFERGSADSRLLGCWIETRP